MAQEDNQLIKTDDKSQALKAIDERLAGSESPQDIILWTQVRGEILRQNEEVESRRHQRHLERLELYSKMLLSLVAISVGVLLSKLGYVTAGFFALGAGLFWLAPDLVKTYFNKFGPKE
jgi:hypothetical protein